MPVVIDSMVLGRKRFAHNDRIAFLTFSPDGTRLVSNSQDRTIRVWEVSSGRQLRRIDPPGPCGMLFFRPDGRIIGSRCAKAIWFWDVETGDPAGDPIHFDTGCFGWALSPDGSTIAAITGQSIQLFDSDGGHRITKIDAQHEWRSLMFSPSGDLLVASNGFEVHGWDAQNWHKVISRRIKKPAWYISLVPAAWLASALARAESMERPDSMSLRVTSEDRRLLYGDLECILPPRYLFAGPDVLVEYTHFSHPSYYGHQIFRLWNLGTSPKPTFLEGTGPPAFSPDGKLLAAPNLRHPTFIRIWDTDTFSEVTTPEGHVGRVSQVRFTPRGDRLLSGGEEGSIYTWARPAMNEESCLSLWSRVKHIAFSPDGRLMVVPTGEMVRLFAVESHREVARLNDGSVLRTFFSPTDPLVICARKGGAELSVWDYTTGNCSDQHYPTCGGMLDAAMAPDAALVAMTSADFKGYTEGEGDGVILYSLRDRKAVATIHHERPIVAVAFSPDGRVLATGDRVLGDERSAIHVWDLSRNQLVTQLPGHGTQVVSLTFCNTAPLFASAGSDGTFAIWDTEKWAEITRVQVDGGPIHCIDISPDGAIVAVAPNNTTVAVFDVARICA